METINKKRIEEFIRVDHAGERGAVKIYEGQLLALNTLVKDEALKKTIEEMKVHEKEHSNFFEEEIKKRNIKPTKFLPLWDLLGVGLGFGSTLLSKEEILRQLQEKNVSCKDVTFKILGLSLTSYNIIISILIIYFTTRTYLNYDNN